MSKFKLNVSEVTKDAENYDAYAIISLLSAIVLGISSPVAVAGNSLVLAAIWRNPSLRTPSYILLAGLAFTDLCAGLVSVPSYIVNLYLTPSFIGTDINLVFDMGSWPSIYFATRIVSDGCGNYFFVLTALIITLMSIERWLHMSRRSLVTARRACVALATLLPLPIPLVVYRVRNMFESHVGVVSVCFVVFCLANTSVAYFKVFQIIRHHQQQVHVCQFSQNNGQPAINFAKYRKSVFTILYILAVFYTGYLPVAISMALILALGHWAMLSFSVSVVFAFLSSSLNPILYLWRMKDIRNEVKEIVKRIFCKKN